MNFLRRIYLLLLGLLLVIAVTLLLLSPQAVGSWVGSISELSPVVRLAITIVIDLFLLVLMYLQVRPDPGAKVNGLVMRGSGAITEVSVESARDRILKAVSDVPDVVSAEATVKPVRGSADIEMQVVVMGNDVKLPNKQKEINRALRQVIDKQLGLRMAGQPRIHIRIHGEEATKPPVIIPAPVAPVIEREVPVPTPAVSVVTPPAKIAPEPESKPSTGLMGGWSQRSEPEEIELEDEDDEEVGSLTPKLAPIKSEPASDATNPLANLFGGLRRNDDVEDEIEIDEDEDEEDIPSSWSISVPSSKVDTPPAPLTDVEPVTSVIDEDLPGLVDLDEELSLSAVDDFDEDVTPEKSEIVVDDGSEPKKPDDSSL
jgi:hypothetical protein